MFMLLNIDKPLRTARLHSDDCKRIPDPVGTDYKLVGELGRDGGWFRVRSEDEARSVARSEYPRAEFIRCSYC